MDKLRIFVHTVDTMNRRIALGLMWLTLVIAALLTLTAIARYVFHHPLTWTLDATMFVSGGFLLLAGAYCLLVKAHVNMDIVRSRLSLRAGATLDILTSIFIFALGVVLLWKGGELAWYAIIKQQRLLSGWAPLLWPLRITIPIAALLLLLQWIANLMRDLHIAITGREME